MAFIFIAILGFITDTVYLQIDGGSENTAKRLFWCATYNQPKVMQKVRFDQADGYTHYCDIDAIFGRLWKHIRNKPVLSPFDSSQNFTH